MGAGGGLLWGAYGISALGTWLAFDAFPLIAVLVLHSGPLAVSVLAAAGLAVGAVAAVPLGPWLEYRRKRPVMVATDLVRCAALLTIPVAHLLGALTFVHLLAVSVVVAAADIAFRSASGAYIKTLLPPEELLVVNARFESTNWTAIVLGPPLGGAMVGLFGPVVTVLADAASYLLSALGLRAITAHEPRPARREEAVAAGTAENTGNAEDTGAAKDGGPAENADSRSRTRELFDGWRFILRDPALRPLFGNTVLYNGLLMAISPLLAVLMLGPLGFAPWQYGLAFALPALGGLVGSRLARRLVARFGQHRILLATGVLRACWPLGLAFVRPGVPGLVLVLLVEFGVITSCGVFNPVYATYRLERTPADRVVRTLSAWSVSTKLGTAALTALWGLLAALLGPRTAIAAAGLLLLATPLLLPRRAPQPLAFAE
ncbi:MULTISPECIES: MFS transporter [Streptomyces]|uniref:MFS transporter n=1 Tax=Streptomyces griseoaurantiacus TaxID=68213 RepID=A0A7W2DWL6_9ACTN|nr:MULTISPECIES: MFS transporter [Streptomyces]MBA5224217.1 MFS transporter [Streptomyces griseoaurantiacus]MDX3362289.1 MFS transporter [Streptomyces sp. ME02-6978.2a]